MEILDFPTRYPPHQWYVRQKLARLLRLLGWDAALAMQGFSAEPASRWWTLDDERLAAMLNYLQGEYALSQGARQAAAPAAPFTRAVHKARVYAFPLAVQTQKAGTGVAHTAKHSPEKARLIRKVQMLKRDAMCKLPEFTDATYRAILFEQFDAASSTELSPNQLASLLLYVQGLFTAEVKPCTYAPALLSTDPKGLGRQHLMQAMQAQLAEKGKEEGRYISWAYAEGILKRQTGGVVTCFADATPGQLQAVLAALGRDAKRKGRRVR